MVKTMENPINNWWFVGPPLFFRNLHIELISLVFSNHKMKHIHLFEIELQIEANLWVLSCHDTSFQ